MEEYLQMHQKAKNYLPSYHYKKEYRRNNK